VKPDRSLSSVEPASVRKKMKDKAFARSVRREDLVNGARDLGVDLDEHIRFVTDALKPVAHLLGVNP
jgi:predicted hydrolase (HD superfamily)